MSGFIVMNKMLVGCSGKFRYVFFDMGFCQTAMMRISSVKKSNGVV